MPPKKSEKTAPPSKAKEDDEDKKATQADGTDPDADDSKNKPSTNGRKRQKPDEEDDGEKAEPRRSTRQANQQKDKSEGEPRKKSAKKSTESKTARASTAKDKKSKSNDSSKKKTSAAKKDDSAKSRPPPGKRASQPDEDKHGSAASKDRLPKVGQTVYWRAMPGMVEGKVLEILKDDTTVGGKSVRASEDTPQLRLESSKSGKECVHKIDNIYFKDT